MQKGNYYNKYLKYKSKYQQLKQMIGSAPGDSGSTTYFTLEDVEDIPPSSSSIEKEYGSNWASVTQQVNAHLDQKLIFYHEYYINENPNEESPKEISDITLEETSITLIDCNYLYNILERYLSIFEPDNIAYIKSHAFIVCIDNKYYLPDILFTSDLTESLLEVFIRIKNNSDKNISVKIILFDYSIVYEMETFNKLISDPINFLNNSTVNKEKPYLHYMQYIALYIIMYSKDNYNMISSLDPHLLSDYRLFAFIILFNINLLNIGQNYIFLEDHIIKLMKICSPLSVFYTLVFFCQGVTKDRVAINSKEYTEDILKNLVTILNRKGNKKYEGKTTDDCLSKKNELEKITTKFNKHKHYNTSINMFQLETIRTGSCNIELTYSRVTAAS